MPNPIDKQLTTMGITLPPPMSTKGLPFKTWVVDGNLGYLAGHLPLAADGKLAKPLGKVGAQVSADEAYQAARNVAIGMLATLQSELGSLDNVERWLKLFGMVNVAPGFDAIPPVVNGASDLIKELYGSDRGAHVRSAVGMAELPFGAPVEIEAVVRLR